MKLLLRIIYTIGIGMITQTVCAQSGWDVNGVVLNAQTNEPIPFVTILALSRSTDQIVSGATSEEDGTFSLHTDSITVKIEVRFIGFKSLYLDSLDGSNPVIDLGEVKLVPTEVEIDGVEVTAEKSSMEFKLDKRVFNVGKDISSTGMGALELLNNVPSVNVDIEGNITLRGNAGVQILIDGKPSVLSDDPSKVLGTLTADMIESIEIITNPSAKYQAGGTSGIINIILKKEEKKGVNGSISVNTGIPNNHSIGGSINYRTSKFNFFTQFGGGYRTYPSYSNTANRSKTDMSSIVSDGTGHRNEQFYNITLGADYYLNKYNTITLSGNYAYEIERNPASTHFTVRDSSGAVTSEYDRVETTSATNPKWQYDLQYKKQFKKNKEHVLQFSAQGRSFGKDQHSEFDNRGSTTAANQRTNTNFYQNDYTFQLDYNNPLSKLFNLELGSMYVINDVGNDYGVFNLVNNNWEENSNYTNNFKYNQKVLGVYGTGSYEGNKWGVKLGLRVENTDLKTLLTTTNQANNRNYTNLFPSLHTAYKFSKQFSMQAGYSRRIYRPRLWDLNPFFNIQNNYNIRTGNPNLLPEFADSYELTAILIVKKVSLNMSVYHLYTTNVMENISVYSDGVNITTRSNVGTNHKTGVELNGKYTPTSYFSITGDFNYGYFNRQGNFNGKSFNFQGDQWSAKLTAKVKLPAGIDFEITPGYQSGYKTVQGTVSGYPYVDAGIRKKILKDRAVINLAVRDMFASRIQETFVDQATYSVYSFSKRGRFITLGFSYSFGKGEVMSYTGGGRH